MSCLLTAAKQFLKKNKLKKHQEYSDYTKHNMASIQSLLENNHPEHHKLILDRISAFLNSSLTGKPSSLELPIMDPGLLSLILQNMAMYLGNTQQLLKYQAGL